MKDYYYVLGIEKNASVEDIKIAYRKLSKKFHPDLNPDDTHLERMFKDIQEAYECLSDTTKRKKYDSEYQDWVNSKQTGNSKNDIFYERQKSKVFIKKVQKIYLILSLVLTAVISLLIFFTAAQEKEINEGNYLITPAIFLFLYLYFLPTIIYWNKGFQYRREVFIINIFIGFIPPPLLFWVVLLIFSFGNISFINTLVMLFVGIIATIIHNKDNKKS